MWVPAPHLGLTDMLTTSVRARARRADSRTLRRTLGSLLVGAVITSSLTPGVAAAAEVGVGPVDALPLLGLGRWHQADDRMIVE